MGVRRCALFLGGVVVATLVIGGAGGCQAGMSPAPDGANVVGAVAQDGIVCVLYGNWLGASDRSRGTVLPPPVPVDQQAVPGAFRRTGEATAEFMPEGGTVVELDGHERSTSEQNVACAVR